MSGAATASALLDSRFAERDAEGGESYRDYFEQSTIFAANLDNKAVSPEVIAANIVEVLEAEVPKRALAG